MQHILTLALAFCLQVGSQLSGPAVPPGGSAAGVPPATTLPRLAWSDFDGDGLADLLVVNGGTCSLLRGTEAGELVDCTGAVGLSGMVPVAAASWTDYDGDGAPDLFQVTPDGAVRLLRNEAGVEFMDVTLAAGLGRVGPILQAEWGDCDADDRLDLVLWTPEGVQVNRNRGNGTFESTRLPLPLASAGMLGTSGVPEDPRGTTAGGAEGAAPRSNASANGAGAMPAGTIVTGSSITPSAIGPTERWGLVLPKNCAKSLFDQATSTCVKASSTPELGKLYPLSTSLNVNPTTGRVGVGTTTPAAQLEVTATNATALRAYSDKVGAYISSSSPTSPAVDIRSASGRAAFMAGQLEVGYVLSQPLPITVPRVVTGADGINAGFLELRASDSTQTVLLQAEEASGNGAQLSLATAGGLQTIVLDAQLGTVSSKLDMFMSNGVRTVEIMPEEASGNGAQIVLRKADGTASIVLDAEQGTDGRITTETLEITGGADLVESFDTGTDECPPGTVVVIDRDRPGQLIPSTTAYDRRVAGVVSGAGGIRPGLHMGQAGVAAGSTPVALTGRVYVRCSTENGPIAPGDLLTTSSTPGRAMRADDRERCFGAVIGKAMGSLDGDQGLVLVLVNLQ